MNRAEEQFRIERDPLGEARVPTDALYGIQTTRALDNFRISHLRVNPALITAFAEIKTHEPRRLLSGTRTIDLPIDPPPSRNGEVRSGTDPRPNPVDPG